jgi:four helix bundle protein
MARYEHLPIYKKALDVAVHFEKVVAGFSRYHKYTLGSELRNQSRAVVSAIVKANSEAEKLRSLLALRDRLEELTLLVRLSKEVRAFKSFKSYQYAVEEVVSVSRQNEGWIRSLSGKVQEGQNRPASSRVSDRAG